MLISRIYRNAKTATKRAALAAFLCGIAAPVSGEVVDLSTTTLGPNSPAVQQVQNLQPPVLQPPAAPTQPAPTPAAPNQLNVDPNADIDELTPPQPLAVPQPPAPPAGAQNFNSPRRAGAGAIRGSFAAAPSMMGDFFGGGLSQFSGSQTVEFSDYSAGTILSGGPGSPSSILAFEFGGDTVPNDVFTSGTGSDLAGIEGGADSFSIAEPLPPNDALTSPGAGFVFDGGTAVYTNNTTSTTPQPGIYQNGEQWFINYSYTQTLAGNAPGVPGATNRPVPGPGVSSRRVKISENFSPEVRDRWFANYSFFNDVYGGLGDVSRYVLGFERILLEDLISFEARLPMAGTYASTQNFDQPEDRDFEFGNAAFIAKGVLLRSERFLWSGGLGVTVPTADDTRIRNGGRDVLVIKNRTVHLLPFTGLQYRHSADTSFQTYMQLDVAANGDPVFGDLTGNSLPKLGEFNDSTLMHLDAAVNRVIYRNRHTALSQVIANGELHYTGTLQDSDFVSNGSLTYTNLKRNFNVVNATVGAHLVIGDRLVVTPGMSVPLRDGLDEQFDYEALVQVNYLR